MTRLPNHLTTLLSFFKKLPGVGTRTAERFAFELLSWDPKDLSSFSQVLQSLPNTLPPCVECGCITQEGSCLFCNNPHRDCSKLCILSSPKDSFSIEGTHSYTGLYHVIEHLLSPLDGRQPASLRLDKIEERISRYQIKEMIIAFDSTLEGDATALFLKDHFESSLISISRLAFGLPLGSSLEFIDKGTLARSFMGRQTF